MLRKPPTAPTRPFNPGFVWNRKKPRCGPLAPVHRCLYLLAWKLLYVSGAVRLGFPISGVMKLFEGSGSETAISSRSSNSPNKIVKDLIRIPENFGSSIVSLLEKLIVVRSMRNSTPDLHCIRVTRQKCVDHQLIQEAWLTLITTFPCVQSLLPRSNSTLSWTNYHIK